jgi:hypothetical protein
VGEFGMGKERKRGGDEIEYSRAEYPSLALLNSTKMGL